MRRDRSLTSFAVIGFAGLILPLIGCSQPGIEGPQIGRVPRGFRYDPNATAARLVLDRRQATDQRGYFRLSPDNAHSSIMITEYRGAVTPEEVMRAHDEMRSRYPHEKYGPIQSLRIDTLPAWAWLVTQSEAGNITSLCYTAVIPDAKASRSFTVEFASSESGFQDAQVLKSTVLSFTVKGTGTWKAKLGL